MLLSQILLYGVIFLYGIVIGSFLNVCIFRIPKGENIVTAGSRCMKCQQRIKWYDMIPIVSYLILRGRCRYCHAKLSVQYPVIEAVNGLLYIVVFHINGMSVQSVLYCLLVSALLIVSVIDYRTMQIPPGINIFIFIIGVALTVIDYKNYRYHLIGFFSVSFFLLFCYFITKGRGIGGGDIKLMAAAGLCIGGIPIILALVFGCIIGSIIQVVKMRITGEGRKFAFGPYLAGGIFLAVLWGDLFWNWYIGLVL